MNLDSDTAGRLANEQPLIIYLFAALGLMLAYE